MTTLHIVRPADKGVLTPVVASRNYLLQECLNIPAVRQQLLPVLRLVSVANNQVLYEQGEKNCEVYFPVDCVVSGLAIMEDGTTLETSMVGRESLVGLSAVLGSGLTRQWMWV